MSRCSVMRCLPCHTDRSQNVISGKNAYYGLGPQFKLFKGEVKVSPEASGSQLPSGQNNSHAEVTHLRKACSEAFQ